MMRAVAGFVLTWQNLAVGWVEQGNSSSGALARHAFTSIRSEMGIIAARNRSVGQTAFEHAEPERMTHAHFVAEVGSVWGATPYGPEQVSPSADRAIGLELGFPQGWERSG